MGQTGRQIVGTAPLFIVTDVVKAVDYYVEKLGFERPRMWGEPPCFAMPHRDGFIFMLREEGDAATVSPASRRGTAWPSQWDAYVWVNDARVLCDQCKANGAVIEYEPVEREEYGMLEFAVRDLDGYVIAFGQDLHPE